MEAETLTVEVNEGESVTALLYSAAKKDRAGFTIVLGHGAGANQMSGFMRMVAAGLATRGIDAMTFNFLYTERGRRTTAWVGSLFSLRMAAPHEHCPRQRYHPDLQLRALCGRGD